MLSSDSQLSGRFVHTLAFFFFFASNNNFTNPFFFFFYLFYLDVAQNIHIESTLRQPDWQYRVSRVSTKAIIKGALAMQKASERDAHRNNANATGATRKNSDSKHSINPKSKKISAKKFKLGLNSEL